MDYYKAYLGKQEIYVSFCYSQTADYFGPFLSATQESAEAISVPESDYAEFESKWNMQPNAETEYVISIYRFCDELLKNMCCIFHGAAFLWKGKAFILTAASGVGKTTQLRHWQEICGNDLIVLNGDKPVLASEADGIRVYPSPWKGKERMGNDSITAWLGGIIYLEQSGENRIRLMDRREAIEPLIRRVLSSFEKEQTVLNVCKFLQSMLEIVPVWKLENKGDRASAELTRTILCREIFSNEL